MAHDVFISYSSKDKRIADALCAALEGQGIQCWIAPRNITYGSDYGEAIVDGINESRLMVLVFSSNANTSAHIKREVDRAVSKGLTIIPVRIEDVAPARALEYYISPLHWLDAVTPPIETHLHALAEKVKVILSKTETEQPVTATAVTEAARPGTARSVPSSVPTSRRFGMRAAIGGAVVALVLTTLLWVQPWRSGDTARDAGARQGQLDEQQRQEAARQAQLDQERRQEAAKAEEGRRAYEEAARRAEEATKRLEDARRAEEARQAKLLADQKRAQVPVVARVNRDVSRLDPPALKAAVEQKLRPRGLLKQSNADRWGVLVDVSSDGTITLTGVLHTTDERTETLRLAAEVPGVAGVKQRINVPQSWNAR